MPVVRVLVSGAAPLNGIATGLEPHARVQGVGGHDLRVIIDDGAMNGVLGARLADVVRQAKGGSEGDG